MNSNEKVVRSTCRMCHGVCGVLVHIKDGKVIKVTGDPQSPTSHGYICAKGKASPELLYHPNRLTYPIKRAGARGENKWQKISWDEALDTVANRLMEVKKKYGVESIVGTQGTGRPYTIFYNRFMNALGSPNQIGPKHVCYFPRISASLMTCGAFPVCDYYGFGGVYPSCVLVWGCNISETGASDGMCGHQIVRTVKRGAKLIVVDPRRTPLAARADHWLQLRPGTDDALALSIINTIITEEVYDKDFVSRWTAGFDELADRVKNYSPERAEQITGVPASDIKAAARLYAASRPACIQWGNALDQNINTFQTARAVSILSGLTGNIDAPGGDVFFVPPENVISQSPLLNPDIILAHNIPPEIRAKAIDAKKKTVPGIFEVHPELFLNAALNGEPYPVRALFIMGTNILVTRSQPLKMAEALKKIDFITAVDMFMTPTTQFADIILPASSWLENNDVADMHFVWCVLIRQQVAARGECRDDKQIIIDLAHRMGMKDEFPWNNVTEYCDWILKDSGITFDEFKERAIVAGTMRYRKYEQQGFATPSGKFEFSSSAMRSMGFDPLPDYVEPPESPISSPELFKEYPLIITTGSRSVPFFHSEGRQIQSLRALNPDPLIEIHPDTAHELGIENGDWVWVENRRARVTMKTLLSDAVKPGVVYAQHGWWFPEKDPPGYGYTESNINLLTGGMASDPHTGSECWRSFLCRIYKAD